jgi:hypothetical protein
MMRFSRGSPGRRLVALAYHNASELDLLIDRSRLLSSPLPRSRRQSLKLYALGTHPGVALSLLIAIGVVGAALFGAKLDQVEPARVARWFLIGVVVLMGVRVTAWVVGTIFGLTAVRPPGTGPFDPTNLLIGALYGFALRGRSQDFFRAPELQLALRTATGVAFVLGGMGAFMFTLRTGFDYFVSIGYPKTFHFVIMCGEILGGALILLPWPALTLSAAAGLTIDMFGALYTQVRLDQPLDAAAISNVLRLLLLVLLTVRGRRVAIALGAVVCGAAAVVGSHMLLHPAAAHAPAPTARGSSPPSHSETPLAAKRVRA